MNSGWALERVRLLLLLCVLVPHAVSDQRVLNPRDYLDLMSRQAQPVRDHVVKHRAESLALRQGEQWYVPDVTLSSRWEDETHRDPSKTEQRGLTSNLDSIWTSLLGTEINIGLQYQYGEQVTSLPTGLPENYQHNQKVTFEVQQPILRGFSVAHNRIPIEQAREGWNQYRNQGDLIKLEVQQDALRHLVELQRLADRLRIEQDLSNHYQVLLETTEVLRLENEITDLDVQLAVHTLQEQQAAVDRVSSELGLQQRTMSRPLLLAQPIQVQPFGSIEELLGWLQPAQHTEPNFGTHPAWLLSQSEARRTLLAERQNHRDHWPDINIFYRFEKDYRESLSDQEIETFGIQFSYTIYDLATWEQQRRNAAARDTARWQQEDASQRLRSEHQRLREEIQATQRDIELFQAGLSLSERALSQELERYELGFASLLDVERRQDDRLNRALNLLDAQARLATTLVEHLYLTQMDIRNWL